MLMVLMFIIIRFTMMATFSRNYLTSSFSSSKHLHRLHEKVKVVEILVLSAILLSYLTNVTKSRKEWQIDCRVTCVPRHLPAAAAFTITSKAIAEPKGTVVRNATNHLPTIMC